MYDGIDRRPRALIPHMTDASLSLHGAAAARFPGIAIDAATLTSALRDRDGDPAFAADLLLALGCEARDPAALSAFESSCMVDAARGLARLRLSPESIDELLQHVRTKVLLGSEGGAPAIGSFAARGPLAGWVRAVAVREALSARRAEVRRGVHEGPSVLDRLPVAEDPVLAELRARYAVPFKEAFAEVLAALPPRDRNVLRLVYVDGLTAEQVGLTYGVHRVSVARWLGQIRETLFGRTRRLLQERLRLSPAEVDSMTRMCLSQIDVSLDRLLGGA
jgi:RNA polymerase sigma-70 factor, ECF subfamily